MKKATCINCEEQFNGRANRKFCSQSCKNQYHNEKNREKNSVLIELNKALHKNWVVLSKMYELYRSSPVRLDILEKEGFNSKFHTHDYSGPAGKYTMIYDLGYKPYIDNQIQIVKLEEVSLN